MTADNEPRPAHHPTSWPCQRCGTYHRPETRSYNYPVGDHTVKVCEACWKRLASPYKPERREEWPLRMN